MKSITDGRVGKGVGRGAKDRVGDRVARLLPVFAGMDRQRSRARARQSSVCGRVVRSCRHSERVPLHARHSQRDASRRSVQRAKKKPRLCPKCSRGSLCKLNRPRRNEHARRWHFSSQAASGRKSQPHSSRRQLRKQPPERVVRQSEIRIAGKARGIDSPPAPRRPPPQR